MAEPAASEHTGGGNRRGRKASFGSLRPRGPKRFQARYTGPDGLQYTAHSPGGSATFQTKADAQGALAKIRVEIDAGTWLSPEARAVVDAAAERGPLRFGEYARRGSRSGPWRPGPETSTARCWTSTCCPTGTTRR